MSRFYNLARMTTATTGTGTMTLGSAVSSYLSFADAGVADADVLTYAIVDGSNREIGVGVYTASGTTLTRATILESTNGGSAISLTGNAQVLLTSAAEDIRFRGCRLKKAADQTAANYTTDTAVAWDAEVFDTDALHDNVTANTKIIIPASLNGAVVRFEANIRTTLTTADTHRTIYIRRGGADIFGISQGDEGGATVGGNYVSSGPIVVATGEEYECIFAQETDTSITVTAAESWFAMSVLGWR